MKSLAQKIGPAVAMSLAAAALLMFSGCQSPGPGAGDPMAAGTNTPPPGSADILTPGNRITITYSGHSNVPMPHQEVISEDGTVSPPLLGKRIMAGGKKAGDFQDELLKLYVPDYFKTLTIVVTCDERYFFVGGDVRNPRQYPYLSAMTVLKAIQAAGDFNEYADKTKVQITRADGKSQLVDCKKAQKNSKFDLPIYPGDRIFVTRKWI
jgi:protein involved in polysaccharide export with SLBB domain